MRKAFDLRPLESGDMLSRAFALYSGRFVTYLRWALLAGFLPVGALAVLLYFGLSPYAHLDHHSAREPSLYSPSAYSLYHWLLKVAVLLTTLGPLGAGVTYLGARYYVGGDPTLGDVFRAVRARFGHMAGAVLLHLGVVLGITLVCYGPAVLYAAESKAGAAAIAILLSTPAWIGIMCWYVGRFSLNLPLVMLDDAEAGHAFSRASQLSKGFRWRLVGLTWAVGLVVGLPAVPGLLGVPGLVAQYLLVEARLALVGDLVRLGWDAVLAPLYFLPLVVYYFDQRCRKEGYDLAVMARNFGIEEAQLLHYGMNPRLGYQPQHISAATSAPTLRPEWRRPVRPVSAPAARRVPPAR
ncbi:MAG: hypothetical protein IT463_06415 [Planctomycetes bacterium]|nr:hypothetical protein [Planctomycetota bacterium]